MSYLKDEFRTYMHDVRGNANPGACCNGLDNIEKFLNVDVDAEFEIDMCSGLYEQVQILRKNPEKIGKKEHDVRQYATSLNRYIDFRKGKANLSTGQEDLQDLSQSMTWIAFYQELADKLLAYKNNRTALIKKVEDIYSGIDLDMPTLEKDNKLIDIDPFTIYGLFNKGLKDENRKKIASAIKERFEIEASIPTDFDGIPVLNNLNATFYDFVDTRGEHEINNLWGLFAVALDYADNPAPDKIEDFADVYKVVFHQKGIKRKITIGLYWIRPYTYINLDSRNCDFIVAENIIEKEYIKETDGDGFIYINFCHDVQKKIENNAEYVTFPELSLAAWRSTTEQQKQPGSKIEIKAINYWPPLEEYNPGITEDKWMELLNDPTVTFEENLRMLKMMLLEGGESTCANLAETYGGSAFSYNGLGRGFGERVYQKTRCPLCVDDDRERMYTIPFVGRRKFEKGKRRYSWKLRDELKKALENMNLEDIDVMNADVMNYTFEKNKILYGPPGTGKTYHTLIYAVAIIENKTVEEVKDEYKDNYPALVQKYNEYKEKGRVAFTTFHQSYGYEEFIEGIRPVMNEDDSESQDIRYEIKSGVFKAFCEKAAVPVFSDQQADLGLNDAPKIWKVSLEGTGDNDTRTECLANNHIRVGYDEYGPNIDGLETYPNGGKNVLNAFLTRMRIGDIVLSCYSATTIDAVGVVTGDCEWDDNYDAYKRVRKVKWLAKGFNEDIWDINGETVMNQVTVYQLKNIVLDDVMEIVEKYAPDTFKSKAAYPNYVFIIDEINRGNISKIFGELITLIEPAKRKGEPEGMEVTLPYSPKPFSVPSNVYIIGTMNTADRSIALMDTALRRRFAFEEMQPDPDMLDGVMVDKYSIKDMLKKINDRIEVLYDREHTIGHAYFMPLKDDNSIEKLAEIFENKIIPLLQEYFYEDYEKIQLVLGDNQKDNDDYKFIKKTPANIQSLFGNTDLDLDETDVYTISKDAFTKVEAYEFLI